MTTGHSLGICGAGVPATVDTPALGTAGFSSKMESLPPAQVSEQPSGNSPSFLVFGDSLKMHALRHVLETIEMNVLKLEDALDGLSELRITFDGCDAKACKDKAKFIRSLGAQPIDLLQFPIGKVPVIAPLFEDKPKVLKHQGTIFDPKIEVFAGSWQRLHTPFARFVEQLDPASIEILLPATPFHTADTLRELLNYTSDKNEENVLASIIELIQKVDELVAQWITWKNKNETACLRASIELWSEQIDPNTNGPLAGFRRLVCGLGNTAKLKFETTVPILNTMSISTLVEWKQTFDKTNYG